MGAGINHAMMTFWERCGALRRGAGEMPALASAPGQFASKEGPNGGSPDSRAGAKAGHHSDCAICTPGRNLWGETTATMT